MEEQEILIPPERRIQMFFNMYKIDGKMIVHRYAREFIKFLHENNAYALFMLNFFYADVSWQYSSHGKPCPPREYVINAFKWGVAMGGNPKYGHGFLWGDLHTKWVKKFDEYGEIIS